MKADEELYHDGRSRCTLALFRGCTILSAPAVPDIRTPRFLTHRMQPQSSEVLLNLVERCASWYGCLEVRRQAGATSGSGYYLLASSATYVFLLPSTIRSGTSPEMKWSSDGPCSSVSVNRAFFDAGVASERICFDTETRMRRGTRGGLRMGDIQVVCACVLGVLLVPVASRLSRKARFLNQPRSRGPLRQSPTRMSTLSRREEDTLFKATKAHALKECDPLVKGTFAVHCLFPGSHRPRRIC